MRSKRGSESPTRLVSGMGVGLLLGFVVWYFWFADLAPWETLRIRILLFVGSSILAGGITGAVAGRFWWTAIICQWGHLLMGVASLLMGGSRIYLLSVPFGLALSTAAGWGGSRIGRSGAYGGD